MNVQILEKGGVPEYAVIPYADYQAMRKAAEALSDIDAYHRAVKELASGEDETMPFDMCERLCDGANPVAEWRKYRGLTQAQLAAKTDVSQAAIAAIEKGKREPSVGLLRKMADALTVDMDDLFKRDATL